MNYKDTITLDKNERGVYILDPFKGCLNGKLYNGTGCYGICYAARKAKIYGFNFNKVTRREFTDQQHLNEIINLSKDTNFVRMGGSCDPSFDWSYTLDIADIIKKFTKVVIITKHLSELNILQLNRLSNLVINTSVSAIDSKEELSKRVWWYNELLFYCKSILRVVTFRFNLNNKLGKFYNSIQNNLLSNSNVIDTIARVDKNYWLVKKGIVLIKKVKFMGNYAFASIHNKRTYFGYCDKCPEQCGVN